MTHLEMLQTDLANHKQRLIELRDPNFGKARNRKGGDSIESNINPQLLTPSYIKIIKSIEDEIKSIGSKKAAKKVPAKKTPAKKTAKKVTKKAAKKK